jgi:glycosyltransferase involved in cell wall biosynthesis
MSLGGVRRVLHVSADFPDPVAPGKTPVIKTHIDLTADRFDHSVISINRHGPGFFDLASALCGRSGHEGIAAHDFAYGEAVVYPAPPRGILHATMLRRLGDWLGQRAAERYRPDLIVGHKLTVEGLAVRRAAQRLGVPYALSIQGNTDLKIIAARPDLRRVFARVFHEAAVVFPFAPWTLAGCEAALGPRAGPSILLPCPTELDTPLAPQTLASDELLSVFHLRHHRNKNLAGMVRAVRVLEQGGEPGRLTVIGGGSAADLVACRALAGSASRIAFEGPVSRADMQARMNRAAGMVLPSLRESFGLVFVEALFAGIPIIYPSGTAVDGYFPGAPFAMAVNARDPSAIAGAMSRLIADQAAIRAALASWQASPDARRFMRAAIAQDLARGLNLGLEPAPDMGPDMGLAQARA